MSYELKNSGIVPVALAALENADVDARVQWEITRMLEVFRQEAEEPLAALLGRESVSHVARIGAAATLAGWRRRDGLDLLRSAILTDRCPDYASVRANQALENLGDRTLVPFLRGRLLELLPEVSQHGLLRRGQSLPKIVPYILDAVHVYRSDDAGRLVLDYLARRLRHHAPDDNNWNLYDDLTSALANLITPPTVDLVVDYVHSVAAHYVVGLPLVVARVGQLADRPETARRLLELGGVQEFANRYGDAHLDAVAAICRRGRFQIFADGRVRHLLPDLSSDPAPARPAR